PPRRRPIRHLPDFTEASTPCGRGPYPHVLRDRAGRRSAPGLDDLDGEGVHVPPHLFGERRVDGAMLGNSRQPREPGRGDANPEMGLPALPPAGMSLVIPAL